MKIGKFTYTIEVIKNKKCFDYSIQRNKKFIVAGTVPSNQKDNLKLILAEHLIISAIYDINHELLDLDQ